METSKKIEIIKSFAEEIITENELENLFETKKNPIAYDGFEPSGRIHIAQGLLRTITVNKLTSLGVKFKFYVADWFGMLNNKMGADLKKIRIVGEYFIEVWKACGMDLNNVEFIWTSEFINKHPEYWETVLRISMNTSVQRVLRCGQIMGREDSISNTAATILYPLMQAADIHHLNADIAQLGLDQRKVNMLAREVFPKIGLKPPVVISHHMLLGLKHKPTDKKGAERAIEMKMSKSIPGSAIFMTDTPEEVYQKFKKAYCPEGVEEENPVLEYAKYIVFELFPEIIIERHEKFGGPIRIDNYDRLRSIFIAKQIHPLDLKATIAHYVNKALDPIRDHFKNNSKAKKLKEQVMKLDITR